MAERRAHRARQPCRDVKHDRVAVAQVERERLPRHGRAVAHADQLHGRAPALGRAEDHVVRHSPASAARLSSPGQGRGTSPDATARQVLVAGVGGTQLRTAYTATPVHFPCGLRKVNRAAMHRSAVCPARGSGAQPAAWGQRRPCTLPRAQLRWGAGAQGRAGVPHTGAGGDKAGAPGTRSCESPSPRDLRGVLAEVGRRGGGATE